MSVSNWLSRYKEEGREGLLTKPGSGRRAGSDAAEDARPVVLVVKASRQRLPAATKPDLKQKAADKCPGTGYGGF